MEGFTLKNALSIHWGKWFAQDKAQDKVYLKQQFEKGFRKIMIPIIQVESVGVGAS